LIDRYDKEAVLLQIPQDGPEVGAFDRIVIGLYTEKVPYFLEQNNQTKNGIKNKNLMKCKSSANFHNLGKMKRKYEVLKNESGDQYNRRWTCCRFRKMILKFKKLANKFKNKKKRNNNECELFPEYSDLIRCLHNYFCTVRRVKGRKLIMRQPL
jgi:hypothetical protein